MKSLFLKIFLSFWAALALSLVLAILVTIALQPPRRGIASQGLQTLAETVNAYQSGGEHAAHDYLEALGHTQHVRAFVFDPSGHELVVDVLRGDEGASGQVGAGNASAAGTAAHASTTSATNGARSARAARSPRPITTNAHATAIASAKI